MTVLIFKKVRKLVWKKLLESKAFQQHFPYKSSKFSENSNCCIKLIFNAMDLKLGQFGIFNNNFTLFLFLAFLVIAHNRDFFRKNVLT